MSTELATLNDLTSLPTTERKTTDLAQYGGDEFLTRVQLAAPNGKYCMSGSVEKGHFFLPTGEDQGEDLGETVDFLPLALRDKALDTSVSPAAADFDPNSDLFKDIQARSKIKRSGCMYGPSLLVVMRDGRFVELFLGNKSGRFAAKKLDAFMPISAAKAKEFGVEPRPPAPFSAFAKVKKNEKEKATYYAIDFSQCSTPFESLPPMEKIHAEVKRFVDEADAKKANAPEKAAAGRKR